jgi:sugar phosphate permease
VPTNRRRVVFALACITSFLLYLHRYTWNLIRPELQREYGFSNTTLEAIGSTFYFSYGVGQVPSGIVADVFGPHVFLAVIIVAWSLVIPLHAVTGSTAGLATARLLFGAAQAGAYPALGQVTRTWFPMRSRTTVQGWVASFFGRGGGALSSVLMGAVLMDWLGLSWRWSLLVMAGPGVLFGLVFLALYRNRPEDDPQVNAAERALIQEGTSPGGSQRRVLPFREALRHRALRILVTVQLLNAGADIAYTTLMGSYFDSLGVKDKATLGLLISFPLWGGALGGIAGGMLNDRLIRRIGQRWARSFVGCVGKVMAVSILLVSVNLPTATAIATGLFFVKFFSDWTQPTVWGTCTDIGRQYSATVFSIVNTAGTLGAIVTLLIVGPVLDYFSVERMVDGEIETITSFTPMFVIVGSMYVATGLGWLLIDCTKPIDDGADNAVGQDHA